MKKYFSILVILLSVGAFASDKKPQPFVVGTTSGYAPFVSLNPKGDYEGFDIDVASAVAKKLGRPLILKDFGGMPSLFLALKQGQADVLIWAISITQEREKKMEMVYYQGEVTDTIPVLFWGKVPENIESLTDLAKVRGKPVSVEAGSYQEGIFKTCPGLPLKYYDSINDVILDLKYGKCFASSIDSSLVPRFKAKYPELAILSLPLPKEMQSQGNGICIDRRNGELSRQVKQAIAELKREGTLLELEKKWGLNNGDK